MIRKYGYVNFARKNPHIYEQSPWNVKCKLRGSKDKVMDGSDVSLRSGNYNAAIELLSSKYLQYKINLKQFYSN